MNARGATESRSTLVAVLQRRGRFMVAEPFFERGRRLTVDPRLDAGSGRRRSGGAVREARPGDLVVVALGDRRAGRRGPAARVVRVLGRPQVARDVIEALMVDRGLRRRFDPAVEHEARAARAGSSPDAESRRDLRELPTFTIDPASARDFDDAVSAESLGEGRVRVWAHIADVSSFVRPGSLMDREAYRRANSVYVPGAVEPMLPEALSSDACSLVPDRDRLAITVELDLDDSTVTRTAYYRSVIRSDARLDYDRVDRVFAGHERAQEPWRVPLEAARAAAAALAAERARRGALVVQTAEPEFTFDEAGEVVEVCRAQQTEAHSLIEHLMIAANEQVARLLSERDVPALYRVHERPDPQSVEALVEALATLDVPTPPLPEHLSPQQADEAVAAISRLVDAHVRRSGRGREAFTSLILRSLKQAYYSPRNLGHSGLRSASYCHFTSPIRRYPDLVCHRALLSGVEGSEPPPRAQDLAEAGAWTSAREREAMVIERDADDVARCFLLERRLREGSFDEEFEGEVVGMVRAGLFVSFGEGFEGMLAVRRLRGDWWELNEQGTIMHAVHGGTAIRLGDPVAVRVHRIEAPRGRVDLVPV
ncbi:MAG TPA: RNB domain-containing ribonuclease [Solirubrobacteraceae bacterium]|nr:RNB domain-containing ribonuclease [Solirubrobacteraceae bacterium]